MKKTLITIAALTLTWAGISPGVFGQRGMGDSTGVAQQANKPEIVQLSGTVRELKTEPCKMTTGRSASGTHVILETPSGKKVEIHLGPEIEVGDVAKKLVVDQRVAVAAFRTEKMPEDAYVAQTVTLDDQPIRLRDENLRPVWAGGGRQQMADRGPRNGSGKGRWSAGQTAGPGRCAARGQGRGQGRGPAMGGQGRGQCRSCGAACGRGNGQGRGAAMGRGGGQGQGRGRGRAAAGRGRGQGRGMAMGRARGQGRGRGAGWGRSSNDSRDN